MKMSNLLIAGGALLLLSSRSSPSGIPPIPSSRTGDRVTQDILPVLAEQGVINPTSAVDLWAVEKKIRSDFPILGPYGVQNIIQGDPNQSPGTDPLKLSISDGGIQGVINQIRLAIGTRDIVGDNSIPISLSEAYAYYYQTGGQ